MLKVGLTGGIGSGKSTVGRVFAALGIPVYNADAASKTLYSSSVQIKEAVIKYFGESIYEGGVFHKDRLSTAVFGDADKLALLNSIVHPATIQHARTWMAGQKTAYVIKEAALIFESGSAIDLDLVIGVWAPQALRIKRVVQRDGFEPEAVLNRMQHQIEESVKMKLCDYVISNDDKKMVVPQILALHQQLTQKAAIAS